MPTTAAFGDTSNLLMFPRRPEEDRRFTLAHHPQQVASRQSVSTVTGAVKVFPKNANGVVL